MAGTAMETLDTERKALISRLQSAMDSSHMLAQLREHWEYARNHDCDVKDCELVRVMPRGSEEFVLEYAVSVTNSDGQAIIPLFGELVAGNATERFEEAVTSLRKARRGQLKDPQAVEGVGLLSDPGLIVRLAGLDERIPALRFVQRPRQVRELLEPHVAGPGFKLKHVWPELLGHRLGKRAACRLEYEIKNRELKQRVRGSLFAKMYKRRSTHGSEFAETLTVLANHGFDSTSDSDVVVPGLVGYFPDWQMLVMENVPGTSLAELEGEAFANGVRMAGRAIARLHHCKLDAERKHDPEDEVQLLEGWVRLTGEVHDGLRDVTAKAMVDVREALLGLGETPTALVHRDFYEKQVIIDGERTALIDFDTLCKADPAIDLGNVIAHIRLARAKGIAVEGGLEDSFLDAYGSTDADLPRRVEVYTRATILRLVCL